MRGSIASSAKRVALPFFCGKKPSKQNLSHGNPELTNAGTNAVAPGKVSTSILRRRHSLTIRNPGSEMAGVPASLTSEMVYPPSNLRMIRSNESCSLNL